MTDPMNKNVLIAASRAAVSCALLEEVVILNLSTGIYFGLNPLGAAVWEFIQEPKQIGEVVDHLLDNYEVAREVCEQQTAVLLQQLVKHELISFSYASANS